MVPPIGDRPGKGNGEWGLGWKGKLMDETGIMAALRSACKRTARAIRSLGHDKRRLVAQTHRNVIPIWQGLASESDREVVDLAYDLWLANGFRGGSPEEALMTAVRQVRTRTTAGLFLVPRRNSTLQ